MIVLLLHCLWVLMKFTLGIAAVVAFTVGDIAIGGVVLTEVFNGNTSKVGQLAGWAFSAASSGGLLVVWGIWFAKKRVAWSLMIPAILLMVPDFIADLRFPTLQMFGPEVMLNSGFIPEQANFVWWMAEGFTAAVTLCGEPVTTLAFVWLFIEVKKLKQHDPDMSARTAPATP